MYINALGAVRLLTAIGLLSFTLQAGPVTIDDFASGNGATTVNTTQDGATILGGERDIVFGPTGSTVTVGAGALSISNVTSPGSISFMYDGDDDAATGNSYGLGGVDLTMGGSNTRFELIVSQINGPISFGLTAFDSSTNYSVIGGPLTSTGTFYFPFASLTDTGLGADFGSVEAIRVNLTSFSTDASITIDSLRAVGDATSSDVPEPGTWLLMLSGIGALATMRRRRA